MIFIIRIQTESDPKKLWLSIIEQKDALQEVLQKRGRLLYLTKRVNVNGASLFVHASDSSDIVDIVVNNISPIAGVSAVSIIPLYRPRFFPLPKDTSDMKHFVISAQVESKHLREVYKKLMNPNLPADVKRVYYAFTFQDHDENIQYALLSHEEDTVQKFVDEQMHTIKGIVKTEIKMTEKTKPFISYSEWLEYTSKGNSIPGWYRYMENHFSFAE